MGFCRGKSRDNEQVQLEVRDKLVLGPAPIHHVDGILQRVAASRLVGRWYRDIHPIGAPTDLGCSAAGLKPDLWPTLTKGLNIPGMVSSYPEIQPLAAWPTCSSVTCRKAPFATLDHLLVAVQHIPPQGLDAA